MKKFISTLSHTSVAMISKCPRQFFYRYVEGLKIKPNSAMKFGTAYHETHEANFTRMIEAKTPMPLQEVTEFFKDRWEQQQQEVDWKQEKTSSGALLDIGILGLSEYYNRVLPSKDPKNVELRFEIQLPEITRAFVGIIDYVGQDNKITDHKTSSRHWNNARAEAEMQPVAYYLGLKYSGGDLPEYLNNFAYEVVVKKKMPAIQVVEITRTKFDIDSYIARIKTAERLIDAEIFPKTDPTNWYCSPTWCGYYGHCQRGEKLRDLPNVIS